MTGQPNCWLPVAGPGPSASRMTMSGSESHASWQRSYSRRVQLAHRLRSAREAAGLSLAAMAASVNLHKSVVSRMENGKRTIRPEYVQAYARVLNISVESLYAFAPDEFSTPVQDRDDSLIGVYEHDPSGSSGADPITSGVASLRMALDRWDTPPDGNIRSLPALRTAVRRLNAHRLQARYSALSLELPDVLDELARAVAQATCESREEALRLATLAYRAADGLAYKSGFLDLSARIVDHMRRLAAQADDPLVQAAVSYVRTETFFVTGDLATARRALTSAADNVGHREGSSVSALAAVGALHMRAAVVAARAYDPGDAWAHLAEARRCTQHVPEGIYLGTAFGPASLRIHDLAVAVELGDSPASVQRATVWQPPDDLPAERRSHYYIDLARAQLDLEHSEDAYRSLQRAHSIAPQHTREHPGVRQTVHRLLATGYTSSSPVPGLVLRESRH